MALTVLIPLTMSRMGSAVRPGVLSGMVEDLGLSLLANLEEPTSQAAYIVCSTYVWATEVTGAHPIRFLPPPVCKTPPPGPPVSAPGGLCTGQKAAAYPPVGVTADTWHCCDSGGIPG